MQADSEEGKRACGQLGVDVLPTLQFWREGNKLWEHRGILHLQQDLGEGEYALCWQIDFACMLPVMGCRLLPNLGGESMSVSSDVTAYNAAAVAASALH